MYQIRQSAVLGVKYFLAHAPGLVRHGFKPSVDIARDTSTLEEIAGCLRSYEDALAYPPNRAYLGSLYPDDMRVIERPWFRRGGYSERRQPFGELMPEEELYGVMKVCDAFDFLWLEEGFAAQVKQALSRHPHVDESDLQKLGEGHPHSTIETRVASGHALPLHLRDGRLAGCMSGAGDEGDTLSAGVLLENLATKATATMALRTLLKDGEFATESIPYVLNTGEEAIGDSYQRGGGNLAKAVAEMCGLDNATGADIKAFCCAPVHALVMAGSLVASGLFERVAVIGGCSLPKLGMNYQAHIKAGQPIIEDVLAAIAVIVGKDDGTSPLIRMDSVGRHYIGAGSSLRAITRTLVTEPLEKVGLKYGQVDKYAIELQNPEIVEPTGSGDVTERNYRFIAALAVQSHEIERDQIPAFSEKHGMPGFSSTQGHIASAIPFLGHAVERIRAGEMERAMFIAKGSLFLGRMTQMSDGFSFLLERNPNQG
ncbi:MAG: DUF5940 domain-containing protein [Chloroflexi bacterium]|nr:DUF5940 domain-containing protein [Chloroflexota bacterium]